jgi:predicted nucleic acid-binding protein
LEKNRNDALEAIAMMYEAQVVDLDRTIALLAAELSVVMKLPMADSIILATARAHSAALWTQDEHFRGLPDVQYIEKKPRGQVAGATTAA